MKRMLKPTWHYTTSYSGYIEAYYIINSFPPKELGEGAFNVWNK